MDKRVALVTGGTSGIGEAVVRKLRDKDMDVVFTGRNQEAADRVCGETGAEFIRHDVTDPEGWKRVEEVLRKKGRLDVVFANAGLNKGDSDIETIELSDWQHILEVNCTGVMLTCKSAIAVMKENPESVPGSIVVNASVVGMFGLPGDVAYTTTKGAIGSLTKSIAVHCAKQKYNIRCNSIHPGIVETPTIQSAISEADDPAMARQFLESTSPMGRLGRPEEIADLVYYLGTSESSFISGSQLVIDGASTAGFSGV